jgi:hypothetical protein
MCHLWNWHSKRAQAPKCGILKGWRGCGPQFFILNYHMFVSEATARLTPYGVSNIRMIPSIHPDMTPTWIVTQNGRDYTYCSDLDTVVRALEVSNDWRG